MGGDIINTEAIPTAQRTGPRSSLEDATLKGQLLKMSKVLWKVRGIVSPGVVEHGLLVRTTGGEETGR